MWCHLCQQVRTQSPVVQNPRTCTACGYERETSWMLDIYRYHNRRAGIALGKPERFIVAVDVVESTDTQTVIEFRYATVRPKICPVRFAPDASYR